MENPNCKNCIRFKTCTFVEKNNDFRKQMYGMFEYAEWNNIDEIFYKNAKNCKFYINDKVKIDNLFKTIETAKYQMGWLKTYTDHDNLSEEVIISKFKTLKKVINDYEKSLNQN